jgi:hypothetical protein
VLSQLSYSPITVCTLPTISKIAPVARRSSVKHLRFDDLNLAAAKTKVNNKNEKKYLFSMT